MGRVVLRVRVVYLVGSISNSLSFSILNRNYKLRVCIIRHEVKYCYGQLEITEFAELINRKLIESSNASIYRQI